MPKTKISEYSTTNADNTDIEGINIAEGCAPSGINNAIREIMVHLKEFQTGASGDGFTFAGGTLMTGTNTLSGTNVLSGSTTAAFAAGTVSAPSIYASGDTNTGIFFPAADTIAFAEGGAEAMRIDSSGNLGLGVTPSAWSGYKAVEILSAGSSISATASGTVQFNAGYYFDGANKFAVTGNYAMYSAAVGADGSFRWYSSTATGTAGNVATMTERMRIDSSGNLGIGRTPVAYGSFRVLDVAGASGAIQKLIHTGSTVELQAYATSQLTGIGSATNHPLTFTTNDAERARITSGGYFKASNTGSYVNSTGTYHEFVNNAADNNAVYMRNTNATSPYGFETNFSGATPNNTTNFFWSASDSTNVKIYAYSSGTISNRTGTYNSISDLKLKQDIVDASSQWDDIKALRIVKYRLKDEVASDPNYPAYIGVIAQEVEQVSPGLVDNCPDFEQVTKTREVEKTREVTPAVLDEEGNEVEPAVTETYTEKEEYQERVATGTVTKSVKSSIIYMKAVKALQEAMVRIEVLEAQNASLEARLTALETK